MTDGGLPLCRLNNDGLLVFERFILSHDRPDGAATFPAELLMGSAFAEAIGGGVEIESRRFATRFDLAEYLVLLFEKHRLRATRNDAGLWSWLACAYFNSLMTDSKDGKAGSVSRWVYKNTDYRRYYRHLIAGPYFTYVAHRAEPRNALALLCQPPGRPGDVVEQLASRQEYVTNPAVMAIATRALVEMSPRPRQRRGAGGKSAGSARRFVAVIEQFRETWDLSTLSVDELASLMPREFSAHTNSTLSAGT